MERFCMVVCTVALLLIAMIVLLDLLELPRQLCRIADYLERLVEHVTEQGEK